MNRKSKPAAPPRMTNAEVVAAMNQLRSEMVQEKEKLARLIQRREQMMREDFDDKLVKYRAALRECMEQVSTPLFGVEKILLRMDAVRDTMIAIEKKMEPAPKRSLWARLTAWLR